MNGSPELFVSVRTVRLRVGDGTALKSPHNPLAFLRGRGSVNPAFLFPGDQPSSALRSAGVMPVTVFVPQANLLLLIHLVQTFFGIFTLEVIFVSPAVMFCRSHAAKIGKLRGFGDAPRFPGCRTWCAFRRACGVKTPIWGYSIRGTGALDGPARVGQAPLGQKAGRQGRPEAALPSCLCQLKLPRSTPRYPRGEPVHAGAVSSTGIRNPFGIFDTRI